VQTTGVIAQLRTTNLAESIRFYTTKIGFTLEFLYNDFYAGIRAGYQLFHLKLVDEKDPSIEFVDEGGHFHLYFQTDDVSAAASTLMRRSRTAARASSGISIACTNSPAASAFSM